MLTIPVDAIEQRARTRPADPRKVLLAVLVAIPYVLGWTARKVWLGMTLALTAVHTGWHEAGQPRPAAGPRNPYGGR